VYRILRDLHLYLGLFVSPFVLLFAVSVFFLNHGKVMASGGRPLPTCEALSIPADISDAQGRDAVDRVRQVLDQCRVRGEVGSIRNEREAQRLTVVVWKPGSETTVVMDVARRSATLSRRATTVWETISYLHKSPGPHLVAIRGNWLWTRVWRWFADGTIYLLLFISATGVYLWLAIRAERRAGIVLLAIGAFSFFGTIYAILR